MAKKISLFTILFLALLVFAGLFVTWLYGDQVKAIVVGEINKKLSSPVSVKDIRFSVFRHFPDAALEFDEVLIREQKRPQPDTLFYASTVSLRIGLGQLFSKNFSVKSVAIIEGVVKPSIDMNGSPNYEIWKIDSLPKDHETSAFKLEKVVVTNTRIQYANGYKKLFFQTFIEEGNLKGAFSSRVFELESNASLKIGSFLADGVSYARDKNAKLELGMKIDAGAGIYTILSSDLKLEELHFIIKGNLQTTADGLRTNLQVSSPGSGPEALLALIPHGSIRKTDDYSYKGTVTFNMLINGMVNKKSSPLVEIHFGARQVSMTPKNGGEALKQVNFIGFFTNKKSKYLPEAFLSIKQFNAQLSGRPVTGALEISDFKKPFLAFSIQGSMDINLLAGFLKPDTVESMNGLLSAHASFSGKIGQLKTYKASGSFEVTHVGFRLKQKPAGFTDFNGLFTLSGNDVDMKNFSGKIGNNDFSLSGTFTNIWSYLLFPNEQLSVKATLASNELNLDELLEKKEEPSRQDTVYRLHFSDQLDARVDLNIMHLHFQKFECTNMQGQVVFANRVLSTNGLNFHSMEGNVKLSGTINASRQDSVLITADANIKGLNITTLFYQMGNFGQEVITDKNLKGHATAEVQFASVWSSSLVCNVDKVYAHADIIIENGELLNFEPTVALSKYLKGADLRNIRFSTLKDIVEIRNKTIYFSTMEIKSSALDLTASGTHTFENQVDYKMSLLLSRVLGKKVKEQHTEFGEIEDDGLGRTMLYLRMSGPMKNPKFTYDNKSVEDKIVNDINKEKQNLKSVLNQEFGWFKKDTSVVKKKEEPIKKEDIQIDYEDDTEEK